LGLFLLLALWVFFGEVPARSAVGGGLLILAGIYVTISAQVRERGVEVIPVE
jgi:drug/metabolite transporter (DMT)-like permease